VVVVVDFYYYRCNSRGDGFIGRRGGEGQGRHVGLGVWFEGNKRVNAVLKKKSPLLGLL